MPESSLILTRACIYFGQNGIVSGFILTNKGVYQVKTLASIFSLALLSGLATSADACTDFRLTASDGTVVVARSMEFAIDLQGSIRNQLRQKTFATTAPDGKPGLSW